MNYWDALTQATERLGRRDLRGAEGCYLDARGLRDQSPGRVFLTETLTDVARRVWRGLGRRTESEASRWERADDEFRRMFADVAADVLRDVDGGLTGDLSEAVFLLLDSRFHPADPSRGATLLLELFADASRRGTLPAAVVMPGAGVIDPQDLPAVVAAAADLLDSGVGARVSPDERRAWSAAALVLAEDPRLDGRVAAAGELGLGRARLMDLGGVDPAAVADAYVAHLRSPEAPTAARRRAQVRAVSLLANVGVLGAPVPRYTEALDVLSLLGDPVGGLQIDPSAGFQDPGFDGHEQWRERVRRLVEERRLLGRDGVWASLAREGDAWTAVLWHGGQPRDAAVLCDDDDPRAFAAFLGVAGDRILSAEGVCRWAAFSLRPLQDALCEPTLDQDGDATVVTSRPESVPGHPLLDDGMTAGVDAAVGAGTAWLQVVDRLRRGDVSWRSGLHRLARMGDAAARFVVAFLSPELVPSDEWPRVPLVERPAPVLPPSGDGSAPLAAGVTAPDSPRAVVASGRPDAVLAGWGGGHDRWRIVLDRPSRLSELSATLRLRGGGFTLLPETGIVDDPAVQLTALERLASATDRDADVLAVFHWTRICETHNGDLADFAAVRTRRGRGSGVWDAYLSWLEGVRKEAGPGAGLWSRELDERVAASEVVVGGDDQLGGTVGELAGRWGVDTDRPGSWIICDSAVVHWRLARIDPDLPARLHDRLRPISQGHLSLLTASSFLRAEVLEHVAGWLGDGGPVACRSFSDAAGPLMELAGKGASPNACVSLAALVEGVIETVGRVAHRGAEPLLVASRGSRLQGILASFVRGEFAADAARPLLGDADSFWSRGADLRERPLILAGLESLDAGGDVEASASDPGSWLVRDRRRAEAAVARRRLCGLELAAWQAAGPLSVTVVDPRWWRELLHEPRGGGELLLLNADDALEASTGGAAILIDLPEQADAKGSAHSWLTGQGWIEADGSGRPDAPQPPADDDPTGAPDAPALLVGSAEAAWFATLRRVWAWGELGRRNDWLLVVSEAPLPGMADLAAATRAPVASVPGSLGGDAWGPVVWVRPGELEDAGMRRRLAAARPSLIWATDLQGWLPSDHGAGDEYAGAVGFLLRETDAPLRLHASRMPAAWSEAWPDLVRRSGRSPVPVRGGGEPDAVVGDEAPVPVIRFGRVTAPCPACACETELRGDADRCPGCGLDVLRWLSSARRRRLLEELRRNKLASLSERESGDVASPLCLWVPARELEIWTEALDALDRPWRRAVSRSLDSSRPDGTWWICLLGDQPQVPAECRHAVMSPPQDAEELAGLRRDCGGELSLWYHPLELALLDARVGGRTSTVEAESLPTGDVLTPPESLDPAWCWDGVLPEEVQELVTGLPAARVRRLVGTVNWIGAVTRDLVGGDEDQGGRKLVVRLSRVEFEYRFERGLKVLPSLLALLLGAERDGAVRRLDLADLSLDIDAQDLAWCDRLLMTLSAVPPSGDALGTPRLLYVPSDGFARSCRRDVGELGGGRETAAAVLAEAERLAAALYEAVDTAEGDGTVIPVPGDDESRRDLLIAGVVLGVWSLHGGALPGELTTATSLGLRGSIRDAGDLARRLVNEQERARLKWRARLEESWRVGFLETWADPVRPQTAAVVSGAGEGKGVRRLSEFLASGRPGRRILVGPRGSGRCAAAAAAIAGAGGGAEVTVLVPDLGWGARFHGAWREAAADMPPPRMIVAPESRDLGRRLDPAVLPGADTANVLVVLGLEEHPAALRYQLAQRQRDGQLVAVLEPYLFEESWEHLLLTQPESDEMIGFDRLEETARDLRDERADWLEMLGEGTRLGKTRNRDRGEVVSMPVTNLDNALGVIDELCAEDALDEPIEVVAPLLSDLDYLGRGAARRGWLPVYRWELDALMLPGAAQFLAAVCDAAEAEAETPDGDPAKAPRRSWLAAMLPRSVSGEYEAWLADLEPQSTLDAFAGRLRRAGWAADVFAPAESAARLEALVAAAPDESPQRYATRPLMEVWRHAVSGWKGMPPSSPSGPVLTLSTPDRSGGGGVGTLVHLCSGIEGPRRHYRVASRARRRLVLLHQAGSPLARDAAES